MIERYRLTPEARANVDEICAFIARDSLDAALRVVEALEEAFERLADKPELGHKQDDSRTGR